MRHALILLCLLFVSPASAQTITQPAATPTATAQAAPLDAAAMKALLTRLDARQKAVGDYKALVFIEQKEKNKSDLVYEAVVYRRDADKKFMLLFTGPRTEAGKGYLKIDENLWMYDPTVGKWERRTERERIGGTDSRRADFDPDDLAEDYTHAYIAKEKLGRFDVHHLKLTAKAGKDLAYPVMELWVDAASENALKIQERALSGRLMRTAYYPKWERVFSEAKGAHLYFPKEIRIFDEVEKGTRTLIMVRSVDLRPLPANIFTKAWLESKSR